MKQTKFVNLPVIGRIQHGERIDNKVIERGHFLAKIEDRYMQAYLEKFNEQYKGKQSIEIEFFNDEPLTTKYARYNQSGEVCYCMTDSNEASQKTKNGWRKVNCDIYNCSYRQKNEQGKSACNRIGWLKFLIPSICKDRIFLMRITGQTSINRLNDYFNLQRAQGHSIKGRYTLFLKQEEQSNILGKTFNNYVLDIFKKEDFNSTNIIPESIEKPKELSTSNDQNVNNKEVDFNTTLTNSKPIEKVATFQEKIETPKEEKATKTTKKTTIKATKSKSKKNEDKSKYPDSREKQEQTPVEDEELRNCYALLSTFYEKIADKDYLIGEFTDMKDQVSNIAIRPEDAIELEKCDLGTFVKLEVSEIKGRKFAIKLEFIEKRLKKVAA